jgi:hypothetical protein
MSDVKINSERINAKFSELDFGDWFFDDQDLYIRLVDLTEYNAVKVDSGTLGYFHDNNIIFPVKKVDITCE